jgi:transposase
MIAPDVSEVKESLIQDIIKKKRKTREVAEILGVSMRIVQKRTCRYKYNGIEGLKR